MDNPSSLGYQFGTTTVQLTKGSIYDVAGKIQLMVIGENEQWKLEDEERQSKKVNFFWDNTKGLLVGNVKSTPGGTVKIKNKSDEYINSILVNVIEPQVGSSRGVYAYEVIRRIHCGGEQWRLFSKYFSGTHAIQEASVDLARCYKGVLDFHCKMEHQSLEEKRTIALPTLSTDVGFPLMLASQIAIMELIDFIFNKPYAYSLIHLFVKTDYEFDLYKALLDTHVIKK
jgi:hypothetical protein